MLLAQKTDIDIYLEPLKILPRNMESIMTQHNFPRNVNHTNDSTQ